MEFDGLSFAQKYDDWRYRRDVVSLGGDVVLWWAAGYLTH